jgi:hypothetical protein
MQGLGLIRKDLLTHPDRQGRSVVISAHSIGSGLTYERKAQDPYWESLHGYRVDAFHLMGVPFVTAAGNSAEEEKDNNDPSKGKRDRIDSFPQVFADDNFPIITVGATS